MTIFLKILYISDTTLCLSFSVWLISLKITLSEWWLPEARDREKGGDVCKVYKCSVKRSPEDLINSMVSIAINNSIVDLNVAASKFKHSHYTHKKNITARGWIY